MVPLVPREPQRLYVGQGLDPDQIVLPPVVSWGPVLERRLVQGWS